MIKENFENKCVGYCANVYIKPIGIAEIKKFERPPLEVSIQFTSRFGKKSPDVLSLMLGPAISFYDKRQFSSINSCNLSYQQTFHLQRVIFPGRIRLIESLLAGHLSQKKN